MIPSELQSLFVQWARSKGLKKPTDPAGMQVLQTQFMHELQARIDATAAQTDDALGGGVTADPSSAYNSPTHMVRDSGGLVDIDNIETEHSDFTEMVQGKQAALEQAGGDELAGHVVYRDKIRSQLNDQAPYVRTNPQSAHTGVLGQVVLPAIGGPALQAAQWSDDDGETRPLTITVAPVFGASTLHGTAVKFRPYALINFGTRSALFPAEIDVGPGVQLTIAAASAQVQIGLDNTGLNVPALNLQFAGMISFGQSVKTNNAKRTRYIDGIAAGQNAFILNIPLFAQNVTFWRDPIGEAVTFLFFDSNGNQIFTYVLAANATQTDPIQLPGDIGSITVSDTGGAGVNFVRAIFGLSF